MGNNLFATRLNQARGKSGLSMRALSQAAEVSPQSMSQYAKGDAMPPLRSAIKIAEKLGVSLDWLCGLQEETEPTKDMRHFKTYGEAIRALRRVSRSFPGVIETGNGTVTFTFTDDELCKYFETERELAAMENRGAAAFADDMRAFMLNKLDQTPIRKEEYHAAGTEKGPD